MTTKSPIIKRKNIDLIFNKHKAHHGLSWVVSWRMLEPL